MSDYKLPVDIMNKALQHLGATAISTPTDNSKNAAIMNFSYDKVRQAALRRHVWRFSVRRQIIRPLDWTTMIVKPLLWSSTVSYLADAIVGYPLGTNWICRLPNTNIQPSNTAVDAYGNLVWDSYYGPLTAQSWNHETPGQPAPDPSQSYSPTYEAGELAFLPYGNGQAALFQCIQGTNISPMTAEGWLNTHYYVNKDIVSWPASGTFVLGPNGSLLGGPDTLGNVLYQSTSNLNVGNDPQLTQLSGGAPAYSSVTTYSPSQYAYGSDNQVYLCIATTMGNDPTTDYANSWWMPQFMFMGMWQALGVNPGALSTHWRQISANLVPITLAWPRGSRSWPLGTGPSSDIATSNVYHLPAGWMRRAPENPKAGLTPYLGGPTFVDQKDWVFEGDYMISRLSGPVMFRFAADIQDVSEMDPMFCEALALDLAMHTAYMIGQKVPEATSLYKTVIDDAHTVDAIEQGATTEPDDMLLAVRM